MFEQPEANAAEIAALTSAGAYIMGRNMFGPGRGAWDESWRGWWGENSPCHAPVVVASHRPRDPLIMQGQHDLHLRRRRHRSPLARARGRGHRHGRHRRRRGHSQPVPHRRADRRPMAAHRPGHPRPGERLFDGVELTLEPSRHGIPTL
jgi:hypothetical protein